MKFSLSMVPLVLALLTFTVSSRATEPKPRLASAAQDGAGTEFSAEFRSSGSNSWRSGHAKTSATEQTYTASQALLARPEETLTASIEYHQTDFNFETGGNRPPLPERLIGASIGVLYTRELNPKWSYGTLVEVGSFTAGQKGNWSTGGWSGTLGAVANYHVSPRFSVKLGAVYQTLAEGDERVVPTLGFAWQINDACRFSVGFPRTALSYQLTGHLRVGLVAKGNFDTYRMKSEPSAVANAEIKLRGEKLSYDEIDVSAEAEYACTSRLTLRASLGAVLQRSAEYRARSLKLESRHTPPIGSFTVKYSL